MSPDGIRYALKTEPQFTKEMAIELVENSYDAYRIGDEGLAIGFLNLLEELVA